MTLEISKRGKKMIKVSKIGATITAEIGKLGSILGVGIEYPQNHKIQLIKSKYKNGKIREKR